MSRGPASMRPPLSIVIVNYKSSAFLARCLKSVYDTVTAGAPEVIVIDNGTADDALHALRATYGEATFVMNPGNAGFVAANNQGAAMARGEFLLLLNPDAELTPGAADAMIAYLRSHPRCGVVGPQLLNSDGTPQMSHFPFPGPWSLFLEHVVSVRAAHIRESASAARARRTRPVDTIRGACMMMPLDVMRDAGGMNRDLFMYSEETDLCYRIRRSGRDVVFLPSARVVHHERRSMETAPDEFVLFHYLRSRIVFLRSSYPPGKARLCVKIIMAGLRSRMAVHRLLGRREAARYFESLYERLLPVAHGTEEKSGASPVRTS